MGDVFLKERVQYMQDTLEEAETASPEKKRQISLNYQKILDEEDMALEEFV